MDQSRAVHILIGIHNTNIKHCASSAQPCFTAVCLDVALQSGDILLPSEELSVYFEYLCLFVSEPCQTYRSCLVWCRSRLFSGGLDGVLTEHSIRPSDRDRPECNKSFDGTGGACWNLAANPSEDLVAVSAVM